jgi:hypothetical protein
MEIQQEWKGVFRDILAVLVVVNDSLVSQIEELVILCVTEGAVKGLEVIGVELKDVLRKLSEIEKHIQRVELSYGIRQHLAIVGGMNLGRYPCRYTGSSSESFHEFLIGVIEVLHSFIEIVLDPVFIPVSVHPKLILIGATRVLDVLAHRNLRLVGNILP